MHTVTVVWTTFERAARAAARLHGVPDVALAIVPPRTGSDGADEQRAKARAAAPAIAKLLLKQ